MSITITTTDNGTMIGKNIVFNPHTMITGCINLQSTPGEEMAYDRGQLLSLDFPGEYDIGGSLITAYSGINGKLNYLISNEEGKVGIIQSPDVLELDEVDGMDTWIFFDEVVSKKLDQLELEGERMNLSSSGTSEF